jgi:hypothetical protein
VAKNKINSQELRDYLLGRLAEKRKAAVEQSYLTSGVTYDELRSVEEGLFEEYRHNTLSAEDRLSFENRLSSSEKWRDRIEFDNALAQHTRPLMARRWDWLTVWNRIAAAFTDALAVRQVRWATAGVAVVCVALTARFWWSADRTQNNLVADLSFEFESGEGGTRGGEIRASQSGTYEVDSSEPAPELSSTDQYALKMRPKGETFLYVFQWDTLGNISVLFPNSEVSEVGNPVAGNSDFRIPPTPGWFAVEKDSSIETIGLLASAERWEKVETYVDSLTSGTGAQKTGALIRLQALFEDLGKEPQSGFFCRRFTFRNRR